MYIHINVNIYITEVTGTENGTCLSCDGMYQLCYDVILSTGLIATQCLDPEQEPPSGANIAEGESGYNQ